MRTKTLLLTAAFAVAALSASCSEPSSGIAYEDLPAVVDVVALGGSNVGGYGLATPYDPDLAYPAMYANSLGEEADVEIRYASHHTLEHMATRHLSMWNKMLLTDEQLRADLEAAEIVIIEIGVHTILMECGWYPDWTVECLSDTARTMSDEYQRFFDTLDQLVSDDTVVMAFNQGLPRPTSEHWRDHPDWPAMKTDGFEVWWGSLDTAATAHNAIVIDTAHMGLDDEPDEYGIGPEYTQPDNAHFNQKGHRLFADLLLIADTIGSED